LIEGTEKRPRGIGSVAHVTAVSSFESAKTANLDNLQSNKETYSLAFMERAAGEGRALPLIFAGGPASG